MNPSIRSATVLAIFALATGCLGQGGPTTPSLPEGKTRVLFIGNSLTYFNDLPGMVTAVGQLAGDSSIATAGIAFPDYALEDHWSEGSAGRALTRSRWEFVVMQQGPSSLPESQANLVAWAGRFEPMIRKSGAEPVLYMVWPSSSRAGDFPGVLTSYRNAAAAVGGQFAPAGDAWRAAWAEDASAPLYGRDGFHPSVLGTYLAALVIVARIRDLDPLLVPPAIPIGGGQFLTVPESTVRLLQRAARTALDRNPARPTP